MQSTRQCLSELPQAEEENGDESKCRSDELVSDTSFIEEHIRVNRILFELDP